jgi:hypothetical protein
VRVLSGRAGPPPRRHIRLGMLTRFGRPLQGRTRIVIRHSIAVAALEDGAQIPARLLAN